MRYEAVMMIISMHTLPYQPVSCRRSRQTQVLLHRRHAKKRRCEHDVIDYRCSHRHRRFCNDATSKHKTHDVKVTSPTTDTNTTSIRPQAVSPLKGDCLHKGNVAGRHFQTLFPTKNFGRTKKLNPYYYRLNDGL